MMGIEMVATVSMKVHIDDLPNAVIDDDLVTVWITQRLNDARNHFIRNVSRGSNRRSLPGEFPATDSGRLVGSVSDPGAIEMLTPRMGSLRSDLEYAEYLTTGTRKMAPRKMLGDALDAVIRARPEVDHLAKAAKWEKAGDGK